MFSTHLPNLHIGLLGVFSLRQLLTVSVSYRRTGFSDVFFTGQIIRLVFEVQSLLLLLFGFSPVSTSYNTCRFPFLLLVLLSLFVLFQTICIHSLLSPLYVVDYSLYYPLYKFKHSNPTLLKFPTTSDSKLM